MLLKRFLAMPRAGEVQKPRIVEIGCVACRFGTSAADIPSDSRTRQREIFCFHQIDLRKINA